MTFGDELLPHSVGWKLRMIGLYKVQIGQFALRIVKRVNYSLPYQQWIIESSVQHEKASWQCERIQLKIPGKILQSLVAAANAQIEVGFVPFKVRALWRKPHRAGECVYSAIEITCQFAAISQIDPVSRLVGIEDGGMSKMPYCGGAIIQIPLISQSKTIMDGSIVFIESQTPHQVRDIVRARQLLRNNYASSQQSQRQPACKH